ncbi:MAG: tributyrin esterase [Methanothrix sp.]|nr:tributyrin esterase [Methanothrix sp.]
MPEIKASNENCLCDFTFDFYWQHQGSRLNPDQTVCNVSFRKLVEALRRGETVRIFGDAGSRLGSSMGVDLMRLGGKGGPIESTGNVIVDGDVGSRMGIGMLRGAIYVSGRIDLPMGNVIEVECDRTGYRKFISITEALEKSTPVLEPNLLDQNGLVIDDGLLRDTICARNPAERVAHLRGNAGMSTGILMRSGLVVISGGTECNTGVLMQGGRIIVRKSTGDFTGAEMRGGEIFVAGDAGSFACAKMSGGAIYARDCKPLPPAIAHPLSPSEQSKVAKMLKLSQLYAMMYRRFSI